ncbi:MAG: hypothetical protein COV75_06925 [Candidatus Omnitrophica bacterium CG11_big_fil_rev_8_21_14_0_20_63_9]|nr:MAG: hypothetical protein COV75_06925 [Candidatus Omnitrophica bacterium CG11_big_fil_rev_8_21_14_0_20_63_9]
MTDEEIRVRSIYLYLSCSQAVERYIEQLLGTFAAPPASSRLTMQHALRRELGLIVRYWITRLVWQRLDANEADAKALNLALLRLFTEGLRLPRDGSGLRYAELSTLPEETLELQHRIVNAIGVEHAPLVAELQRSTGAWREATWRSTTEALDRPLDQLSETVRSWAQRPIV